MSDEMVARIKSRGHWRINFRPTSAGDRLDGVTEARRLVERATVSLRGWDFPHMPGAGLEGDRILRLDNCSEASTDWRDKHELWRVYVSSQFIHLKGIRTDWLDEDQLHSKPSEYPENILGLVDNIWHVTEAFEFLARLAELGLYKNGTSVSVGLMNTAGRTLYSDDHKRSEFYWARRTDAHDIVFQGVFRSDQIVDPRSCTKKALNYIFDRFAFEPSGQVLDGIIDELYGLNIGRG